MNLGEQHHMHRGCEEPAEEKTLPSTRSSDGGVSSDVSHISVVLFIKIQFKSDLAVFSLICLVKINSSSADLETPPPC